MGLLGVKSYLFVLLGSCAALPVALFGTRQAHQFAEEARARQDASLQASARSVASLVTQYFDTRKHDMEQLAASVGAVGELRGKTAQRILGDHHVIHGVYSGSYLGDPSGNVLTRANAHGGFDTAEEGVNYSDRDYYKALVATFDSAISNVQLGKVLREPNVQVAAPIFESSGRFIGYAEGSVDLRNLGTIIHRERDVNSVDVVLLDSKSKVVFDTSTQLQPLTDVSPHELYQEPGHEEVLAPSVTNAQARSALSSGGVLTRAVSASVEHMPGWRVIAMLPQAQIDDQARQERYRIWWTAALTGGFAILLAAGLSSWLGYRFRRLERALQAVGRGDSAHPDYPPAQADTNIWEPREVQSLQRELGLMAKELTNHRKSLQALVDARTVQLADANQRLQFLVNALERAENGIEITDPDGVFLYANPALEVMTGYRASELLGTTPFALNWAPQNADVCLQPVTSGDVRRSTFACMRKDGTLFEQECTTWPILNEQGQVTHFVSLRKDVTAQRHTEQALRLSERMASLGTLAAGVAHEINNPLTYVLLSLRLAQKQIARHALELPQSFLNKTDVALDNAIDGAERVSTIVKDLRQFSRSDETTVEPVDPRAVLDSALRLVGSDIRHRAQIECDYQATPLVTCNHAKLHQVFLNLLVNASYAIEQAYGSLVAPNVTLTKLRAPEVRVSTMTDAHGDCVIEVKDNGIGIAPEHIGRIFDPFFTTKPVGVGTGLGLSLCRTIVSDMDGEISVTSKFGEGTTFRIALPRARAVTIPPSSSQSQRQLLPPRSRILIVDDDLAVADSVCAILNEYHDVDVARSGPEALRALRQKTFDLVLCDIMMPEMNGFELYRNVQVEHGTLAPSIVFVTAGLLGESDREFISGSGCTCLEKPVTEEQLHRAVRESVQAERKLASGYRT
jgi:PAS domain S-box-containing protein